jgi:putative ABC transport system substrate-binding protein
VIRRRDFITLLGSAAAWPVAAQAQQPNRPRRLGVLVSSLAADDPEWQVRGTAFTQALQERGWTDGRNIRIEYRFGLGDPERLRKAAAELLAFSPEVILAAGNPAVEPIQQAAPAIPLVFANVADPVANGYVTSLARPGGNTTGFMATEFGVSAKSLELLKEISPRVTRVAIMRTPGIGTGPLGAVQAVAPSFGVELTPILIREVRDVAPSLGAFVRGPNDGMIVLGGGVTQATREQIILAAARHRLPTVYQFRRFVEEGGLISLGNDQAEPYRLAAGYVDRILKGEKPADLPVQAPNTIDLVINLKTAKALGIAIPATVLVRADEVIE